MIICAEFMRIFIMLLTVRKVPGCAVRPKIKISSTSSAITKAIDELKNF